MNIKLFQKNNIGILLIVLMVFIEFLPISVHAEKSSRIKLIYKEYVEANLSDEEKYPYGHYKLYDINRDGIPELFFEYMCGVRSGYEIFTYRKGKVTKIKSIVGGCRIYKYPKKKAIIVLTSSGATDNCYTMYCIKDKKLKKKVSYSSCDTAVDISYVDICFYKNKKKISESQFRNYVDFVEEKEYIKF